MIEKFGREYLRTEYRINKKDAECFRTEDREEALSRLAQLQAKRPGVYTMQTRNRRENRYGQPVIMHGGGWENWR